MSVEELTQIQMLRANSHVPPKQKRQIKAQETTEIDYITVSTTVSIELLGKVVID